MTTEHKEDHKPEEAPPNWPDTMGPILITKEMAIKIAGLAHVAEGSTVILTQSSPLERGDQRVYPIEVILIAKDTKLKRWHEKWEVSPYPNVRPVLREKEAVSKDA